MGPAIGLEERVRAAVGANPPDVAALRAAVAAEREAALAAADGLRDGAEQALRLTRFAERTVAAILDGAAADAAAGLSVMAVGGFGRAELAPGSDLDVLVLCADAGAKETAARVVRLLWDAGFQVGHATRDLREAREAIERDVVAATALLEGRFLAGSRDLAARLEAEVTAPFWRDRREAFVRAKLKEAEARHAARGRSPYLKEPHLKEGVGALRDLALLPLLLPERARSDETVWARVAARAGAQGDAAALAAARTFMLGARFALHRVEGRKQDRLELSVQPRVAARLGYADTQALSGVEAFLRDYYRAARAVHRAFRILAAAALPAREGLVSRRAGRHPVDDALVAVGDALYLASASALDRAAPLSLVEVFRAAQRQKLDVSFEVEESVRRALPAAAGGLRADPRCAAALLDVLSGRSMVAKTLRSMHSSGLLGEMLPEWGDLDALPQLDPYHAYTVDEHTLRAIAGLEAMEDGPEREDLQRREVLGRVRRMDLLRLALLLHDVGKGRGGDHVAIGVALVPDIARRLGLPLDDARTVLFLVEHHLTLSDFVERRDVDDKGALAELARTVESAERLDLLYLLTCADVRAVGDAALPRWKDYLLAKAFQNLRATISCEPLPAVTRESIERELLPRLPPGTDAAHLSSHLDRVPARYLIETEPSEVLVHLDLLRRRDAEGLSTAHRLDQGFQYFWVCAGDRPRLFARIAGTLSARGLNILHARAHTRADGIAVDRFVVEPAEPGIPVEDAGFWSVTQLLLAKVLRGEADLEALLRSRANRVPFVRRPDPPRPTHVSLTNRRSDTHTVVEVAMRDRVGLLYALSSCLSSLGLDIHSAKISTRGNLAADVFHVTRDGKKVEGEAETQAIAAALGRIAADRAAAAPA